MPPNDVPLQLQPAAQAALKWINAKFSTQYELTGVVDVDDEADVSAPVELGLILCDGDVCLREQVRITPADDAFQFELIAQAPKAIPPLLDPPPGIREGWMDKQLENHEFILLLFYRGLW